MSSYVEVDVLKDRLRYRSLLRRASDEALPYELRELERLRMHALSSYYGSKQIPPGIDDMMRELGQEILRRKGLEN